MNKFWGHLKTITHHRHLVMRGCLRMGLIWQGLTHDLSKYSPTEFFAGVRYFQGSRSPNTAERRYRSCVCLRFPRKETVTRTGLR